MASQTSLSELLKKTTHYDKDERFMAISDLTNHLQKDIKLDTTMERRVTDAILDRLAKDTSNDVQAVSVKCLSTLMERAHESQVKEVCGKLCEHLLHGKAELRDIYSIGLKTLVSNAGDAMGPAIATTLTPVLTQGVGSKDAGISLECMDVLFDLLKRNGSHMASFSADVLAVLLTQLHGGPAAARKRASASLGALAVVLADKQLDNLVEKLLRDISAAHDSGNKRMLIQTIGTISRQVGFRLGRHLHRIVPLFLGVMGTPDDEDMHTDESNDLRENCLQGFESVVLRCPNEVTAHIDSILNSAVLPFIKYDPNYTYDDFEDEEEEDEDMSDDEYYDDDSVGSDGDDTSWKVRRSAARVLTALVRTRPELLRSLYDVCGPVLIDRFKEREESVKLDVLNCFGELVRATLFGDDAAADFASTTGASVALALSGGIGAPPRLQRQRSSIDQLRELVAAAVKASVTLLVAKSSRTPKTKVAVFSMLRSVAVALAGSSDFADHVAALVPPATACLTDANGSLRLEALQFLRVLLDTCPAAAFTEVLEPVTTAVVGCATDDWYKIVAECLRVVGRLACAVRPVDITAGTVSAAHPAAGSIIKALVAATMPRLAAHDIDHEIKECAISATGLLLAHAGNMLTGEVPRVLSILVERLRNEITRLPTLKALCSVAASPVPVNLASILDQIVPELQGFLRQQSRVLRQTTLELLILLAKAEPDALQPKVLQPVVAEASAMISDDDLHLCHLALDLCSAVVQFQAASTATVVDQAVPAAFSLLRSPLLQTSALQSLLQLFRVLLSSSAASTSFDELIKALFAQNYAESCSKSSQRLALNNVAKCVAVLCQGASAAARGRIVTQLLESGNKSSDPDLLVLNLLCVGEIGSLEDISNTGGIFDTLLSSFTSANDHVRTAAAFALGGVCVGGTSVGLGVLVKQLHGSANTYLLLSSLKEVLSQFSARNDNKFGSYVDRVLALLEDHCESKEEGIRNMVSECLGKLASLQPDVVVPRLTALIGASSPLARWTAVTSLKYAASSASARAQLQPYVGAFLECLRDDDLGVRRAAFISLNAIVHHDVSLVRHLLIPTAASEGKDDESKTQPTGALDAIGIYPIVYYEMRPRKDLIREMDLGPFKHKVDEGLDLRKSAFALADSLLERANETVAPTALLPLLLVGLADQDDVKMQCDQLVSKLARWPTWQTHLLGSLAAVSDCFEVVFNKMDKKKDKTDAVNDVVRSTLRAVDALRQLPNASSVRRFDNLLRRLTGREPTASLMAALEAERSDATGQEPGVAPVGGGAGGGAGAGAGHK